MQTKIIALAIFGLVSIPAVAQSNVTVYGLIDGALAYGKSGDSKFTGIHNDVLSGNRFGLKGSEDLGNGLRTVFVLEQGFAVGNGQAVSSRQFHRQAYAGIEGSFGTIALGRQYAPGFLWNARITNAVDAGLYEPQSVLVNSIKGNGIEASIVPVSDARWDNSISYDSGDMSGLNVRAVYSFFSRQNETGVVGTPDASDDDKFGLGVAYSKGPVKAGFVYHRSNGEDENMDELYLAASYNLGFATVNASVQTAKMDEDLAKGVIEVDSMVYTVGALVPVGAGNIHAAVGKLKDDARSDSDATSATLGYTHNLSKRTNLTFVVNHTQNDDNSAVGVLVREAGKGSTAIAAGVRHKF